MHGKLHLATELHVSLPGYYILLKVSAATYLLQGEGREHSCTRPMFRHENACVNMFDVPLVRCPLRGRASLPTKRVKALLYELCFYWTPQCLLCMCAQTNAECMKCWSWVGNNLRLYDLCILLILMICEHSLKCTICTAWAIDRGRSSFAWNPRSKQQPNDWPLATWPNLCVRERERGSNSPISKCWPHPFVHTPMPRARCGTLANTC